MFNNYKDSHLDEVPDLFCENCGARIEEPAIFAEGTEYEKEVNLCEDCLRKGVGSSDFAIL
jgi:hypothetical protein